MTVVSLRVCPALLFYAIALVERVRVLHVLVRLASEDVLLVFVPVLSRVPV